MGTEAFWVPTLVAALGTGVKAVNDNNAKSRQNAAEVQAIGNQQQYRDQANSDVKNLTNQLGSNNPQAAAAKETGDFVNTLRKNQGGAGTPSSALAPVAGGSSRYGSDVAASGKTVQNYGADQAGQVSAVDTAIRQRQNEGLAMSTLGTNLNMINANSQSRQFVDQLRAQTAGQASPWANMAGTLLQNAAAAYSKNPYAFDSDPNSGALLGNGSVGGNFGGGLPGSAGYNPQVNPWFDTTGQRP